MWADFSGKAYTREQFAQRITKLNWTDWKPIGITLHNTAAPTLAQWAESGPAHAARIRNLQSYYEGMGWHGGPHWFISRNWLNEFSNPLRRGTHSPSFNARYLGIEMVGDFDREQFNSGDGAKVRDNAVFAMAVLCQKFGWDPAKVIKLHKEDPRTDHNCPGKNVEKADVIARVKNKIERLGGKSPIEETVPAISVGDQRLRMGQAIVDFEAWRDGQGRIQVYAAPSNDGGGAYEVAGINVTNHPQKAAQLKKLIEEGHHKEAEIAARDYILEYTNPVTAWHDDPGVEFYLRDSLFNRGPTGAARILQRSIGVDDDGIVGKITRAAIAEYTPAELLTDLRAGREEYERNVIGYRDNLWRGLTKRWAAALATARKFS